MYCFMIYIRIAWFLIGLLTFSYGISIAIKVQLLGIHPWDVLNVGLVDTFGFSIGAWHIISGCELIGVVLILDRTYVKAGTFFNAVVVGSFVDLYLWLDILQQPTHTWTDILIMGLGIVVLGAG